MNRAMPPGDFGYRVAASRRPRRFAWSAICALILPALVGTVFLHFEADRLMPQDRNALRPMLKAENVLVRNLSLESERHFAGEYFFKRRLVETFVHGVKCQEEGITGPNYRDNVARLLYELGIRNTKPEMRRNLVSARSAEVFESQGYYRLKRKWRCLACHSWSREADSFQQNVGTLRQMEGLLRLSCRPRGSFSALLAGLSGELAGFDGPFVVFDLAFNEPQGDSGRSGLLLDSAQRSESNNRSYRGEAAEAPVREVVWNQSVADVIKYRFPPCLFRLCFACGCIWSGGRLAWLSGRRKRYRKLGWTILSAVLLTVGLAYLLPRS